MSLIEKKNLNYLTTVEQYFLSLKDSGLSLSANDYHLIDRWERRGVNLNLLCRAIHKGFDETQKRVRSPAQRISLTYLKEIIEVEIERG